MYRIVFNPKAGQWMIQLARFGIVLWVSIKSGEEILFFKDYGSALEYVRSIGLNHVYRNYHQTKTHAILAGGHP